MRESETEFSGEMSCFSLEVRVEFTSRFEITCIAQPSIGDPHAIDQSFERREDRVSEGGPLRDIRITGFDDPSVIVGSAHIWGSVATEKTTLFSVTDVQMVGDPSEAARPCVRVRPSGAGSGRGQACS